MLLSKIIVSTCTAIGCSMLAYSLGLGMIGAFIAYIASGLMTVHMLRSVVHHTARQLHLINLAPSLRAK